MSSHSPRRRRRGGGASGFGNNSKSDRDESGSESATTPRTEGEPTIPPRSVAVKPGPCQAHRRDSDASASAQPLQENIFSIRAVLRRCAEFPADMARKSSDARRFPLIWRVNCLTRAVSCQQKGVSCGYAKFSVHPVALFTDTTRDRLDGPRFSREIRRERFDPGNFMPTEPRVPLNRRRSGRTDHFSIGHGRVPYN